jgi:hypothetical protein
VDLNRRIDDTCHAGLLVGKKVGLFLQGDHFWSDVRYHSARCAIRGKREKSEYD